MENPFDELRYVDDEHDQIWHDAYKVGIKLGKQFDPNARRVISSYRDFLEDELGYECFTSYRTPDFAFFLKLTEGTGFKQINNWDLYTPKYLMLTIKLGCVISNYSKKPENYRIDLGVGFKRGYFGFVKDYNVNERSGITPDKFIEQIENYEKKIVDIIKEVYKQTQPWDV